MESYINDMIAIYSYVMGKGILPLMAIMFLLALLFRLRRHYLVEEQFEFAFQFKKCVLKLKNSSLRDESRDAAFVFYEQIRVLGGKAINLCRSSHKQRGPVSIGFRSGKNKEKEVINDMILQASSEDGPIIYSIGLDLAESLIDDPSSAPVTYKSGRTFGGESGWYHKYDVEKGSNQIIKNMVEQVQSSKYSGNTPNFLSVAKSSLRENPIFNSIWKGKIRTDSVDSVLSIWHELIVMMGILGTFLGFFLAFQAGDVMKDGISVAVTSSILGMTLGPIYMIYHAFHADDNTSWITEDIIQEALELLWLHGVDLYRVQKEKEVVELKRLEQEKADKKRLDERQELISAFTAAIQTLPETLGPVMQKTLENQGEMLAGLISQKS